VFNMFPSIDSAGRRFPKLSWRNCIDRYLEEIGVSRIGEFTDADQANLLRSWAPNAQSGSRKLRRVVQPFLKESVKRERFPPGLLRNGITVRSRNFCRLFGLMIRCWSLSRGFSSVVVAAGSCDRSLLVRSLPKHPFARYHSRGREGLYL
jgi:hypothetical protein